ncbi:MAG: hypothetical protein JOS17DRAFT_395257 [Linnemannia elongata]|nr:MAG: hypothetical protein JOS17DRAFT_395257 [Linnemannia elongata]
MFLLLLSMTNGLWRCGRKAYQPRFFLFHFFPLCLTLPHFLPIYLWALPSPFFCPSSPHRMISPWHNCSKGRNHLVYLPLCLCLILRLTDRFHRIPETPTSHTGIILPLRCFYSVSLSLPDCVDKHGSSSFLFYLLFFVCMALLLPLRLHHKYLVVLVVLMVVMPLLLWKRKKVIINSFLHWWQ